MRLSSTRSLCTPQLGRVTRRRRPRRAASGANCRSRCSNVSAIGKSAMSVRIVPLSSRAMSSMSSSTSSAARIELSMRSAISATAGSSVRSPSVEAKSRAAFSGCSRSWLAAATKRALGGVRLLGLPLGVLLRGERGLELAGSLLHPLLERLLGLEQRQLGALELRDVVVGRDVARRPAVAGRGSRRRRRCAAGAG